MFAAVRLSRTQVRVTAKSISTSCVRCNEDDREDKKKAAAAKLQELLSKMAAESAVEEKPKVQTARPVQRVVEKRPVYNIKMEKIQDRLTSQMVAAVKDVADEVGGDVTTTEKELLHVILNNKRPDGNSEPSEEKTLTSVITGMKVEKDDDSRADQVRRTLPKRTRSAPTRERPARPKSDVVVKLYGSKRLGIFPENYTAEPTSHTLPTWSALEAKELKLQVTHPPSNIYEEMIRWTERGILWKFPIDNEQGLDEEQNVDFTQHVFLDEHLEGWCPTKGPIRHFMELVLVGLSKNPYITVQAKIDHIHWFRDYFESKKKLLLETGAIPVEAPAIEAKP